MRRNIAFALVVFLLGLTAAFQQWVSKTREIELPRPLYLFPSEVKEWVSRDGVTKGVIAEDRNADDSLLRMYGRDGRAIWLSVSYYRRQWEAHRLLAATRLDAGSGWIEPKHGSLRVPVRSAGGDVINAATLVLRRGEQRYAVLYWYQLGERSFQNVYAYRLALLMHSLVRRRSEGALIMVASITEDGVENGFADQERFIRDVYPELLRSLSR